jgi:hypothetical protein
VTPVQRQDRAPLRGGKREHGIVGDLPIPLTCFLRRENIMAEAAQFRDDRVREVLVGVEARHGCQASSFSRIA